MLSKPFGQLAPAPEPRAYGIMGAMPPRPQSVVRPSEVTDHTDEVRRIFFELDRVFGIEGVTGECSPPADVFETDDAIEILVDLPDVDVSALRIVMKADAVLIVGEKRPRRPRTDATFHLVERGFGRFARSLRITRPCDPSQGRARLERGELHVSIPKIAERRGRAIPIAVGTTTRT